MSLEISRTSSIVASRPEHFLVEFPWEEFTTSVYESVRMKKGLPVTAETRYCLKVTEEAVRLLESRGLRAAHESHGEIVTDHSFANIRGGNEGTIVDLQYKQFVPPTERAFLKDYMIIPYSSKEDVIHGLQQHHVSAHFYDYWLECLFW